MLSNNSHVVKISNTGWYVETRTGFDGPFSSEKEANVFLDLLKSSDAARDEFAGLQFSPVNQ